MTRKVTLEKVVRVLQCYHIIKANCTSGYTLHEMTLLRFIWIKIYLSVNSSRVTILSTAVVGILYFWLHCRTPVIHNFPIRARVIDSGLFCGVPSGYSAIRPRVDGGSRQVGLLLVPKMLGVLKKNRRPIFFFKLFLSSTRTCRYHNVYRRRRDYFYLLFFFFYVKRVNSDNKNRITATNSFVTNNKSLGRLTPAFHPSTPSSPPTITLNLTVALPLPFVRGIVLHVQKRSRPAR